MENPIHLIKAWSGPYSAEETPICGTDPDAPYTFLNRTTDHQKVSCEACLRLAGPRPRRFTLPEWLREEIEAAERQREDLR